MVASGNIKTYKAKIIHFWKSGVLGRKQLARGEPFFRQKASVQLYKGDLGAKGGGATSGGIKYLPERCRHGQKWLVPFA
jgi:hypothetical protein